MTCSVQVPFFLFVVFVVYTLLPFSMGGRHGQTRLQCLPPPGACHSGGSLHQPQCPPGAAGEERGAAKPRVGLWFGLRAAEAGVGELRPWGQRFC